MLPTTKINSVHDKDSTLKGMLESGKGTNESTDCEYSCADSAG